MATSFQRTTAIVGARELLVILAEGKGISIPGLLATVAMGILKNYPSNEDLAASAAALPHIWCTPQHRPSVDRPRAYGEDSALTYLRDV